MYPHLSAPWFVCDGTEHGISSNPTSTPSNPLDSPPSEPPINTPVRSSDIIREMSATGKIPTVARDASLGGSLEEELKASQKQLGDMEAGSLGAKWASRNTGLGESALNTVSQGLSYGLSVKMLDPANGLQTGQLSVPDSQDADAIASKELRGVADGKLSDSATLVGMGQ